MTKINRKVEYALMALKHMSTKLPGELSTAKEISDLYGCSFDVMSRVLQVLANARVLRSEQGVTGGYLILTQLTKLSLFDLFEILCGPVAIARCLHANPVSTCSIQSTCNILSPIHSLNKKLEQFYRELSIADLLVTPGRMVNPDGKIKAMEIA